jgi:methylase of polypeptide subunit release factors
MAYEDARQHEVAFCAEIKSWSDALFQRDSRLPFGSAAIEQYGRGSQKRQDFRVYARAEGHRGRLALCGEVKLPGTAFGSSPFNPALLQDAYDKAKNAACQYFFTWNVEHLALFDLSLWDRPLHEQCIGEWHLGEALNRPSDITRPTVVEKIRDDFLPRFYRDFAEIWTGEKRSFAKPPDAFYISVLESHLAGPMGPVRTTRDFLDAKSTQDKIFDVELRTWMIKAQQWNFDRNNADSWQAAIERAARSTVYILNNRILFYEAVRARHHELRELKFPKSAKTAADAMAYLSRQFREAIRVTGDYDTVLMPDQHEWAAQVALAGGEALDAWQRVIDGIGRFNFHQVPADILGHTFQRLVSPEERHKFGQHYTDETIVDVINAFCIRDPWASVLDPACGSGSFLVRAFYRKAHLDPSLATHEIISGLFGCDINPFPAHLATLNLAARDLEQGNFPRIVRRNFFTVEPEKPFCVLPKETRDKHGRRERLHVALTALDSIVGNPPYVRQEQIPKAGEKGVIADQSKEFIVQRAERAWPGISLSGQSDLHVYFWPVATELLKEHGWFGFLTSSSWLDVRYGFALQRWILQHFRLVAVIESIDEPWFEDARVKTAVTIMQRCDDAQEREKNVVRFVRLLRPLAEILGDREDEEQKQKGAEKLRDLISRTKANRSTSQLRIVVKRQKDLWSEGVLIGELFARQKALAQSQAEPADDDNGTGDGGGFEEPSVLSGYGGGKWGRYLRAPDFYFELMREFSERFVRLGEVAGIKRGITSGCDDFFMPHDVTIRILEEFPNDLAWHSLPAVTAAKRKDVVTGEVAVIEAGDGTLHCVERRYLRPEVHSLMQVDRPVVTAAESDRVVLWVNDPMSALQGTLVSKYIKWGSKRTFASKKSKAVPVPERSSCKGRNLWYDVTGLEPGIGFWPMAQQYRHIIAANPQALPCNHNLFDIHLLTQDSLANRALVPILNSTLIALIKSFYGRYAGTEGNLKTEVVDVVMLEIPDPRCATEAQVNRLESALSRIQQRQVTHLVEKALLECHTAEEVRKAASGPLILPEELLREDRRELDDAVWEVLGVKDKARRESLSDRLYREVALHFRAIRVVEVQKMEQRRRTGGSSSVSPASVASGAWADLAPEWKQSLAEWLEQETGGARIVDIPEGRVRIAAEHDMFDPNAVFFGSKPLVAHECSNRPEAELLYAVAEAGLRGPVPIPDKEIDCRRVLSRLTDRLAGGGRLMNEMAETRAGDEKLKEQVAETLRRWFIHGRPN